MGIPKFESYVVSQPVRALEIFPAKSLERPPLAGLLHQATSLRVPYLVILRPAVPRFSARSLHYSHFLEKRTGDWVDHTAWSTWHCSVFAYSRTEWLANSVIGPTLLAGCQLGWDL